MIIHADDYGITVEQSRAILALSDLCGGRGPLSSASIFANSPAFPQSVELIRPFLPDPGKEAEGGDCKSFSLGLHFNAVEGPCCSDPAQIPLLVDKRGMFRNDFARLLVLAHGRARSQLHEQIRLECLAQLERFFDALPRMRGNLQIDSHQHIHAIPLVFDAMMDAIRESGARLARLRIPDEPLAPHRLCGTLQRAGAANRLKAFVLHTLCHHARKRVPRGCITPLFCGVVLSGRMYEATPALAQAFEREAQQRAATGQHDRYDIDAQAEILFHPIAVPLDRCLDPKNLPFATACASRERDAEAQAIVRLGKELDAS